MRFAFVKTGSLPRIVFEEKDMGKKTIADIADGKTLDKCQKTYGGSIEILEKEQNKLLGFFDKSNDEENYDTEDFKKLKVDVSSKISKQEQSEKQFDSFVECCFEEQRRLEYEETHKVKALFHKVGRAIKSHLSGESANIYDAIMIAILLAILAFNVSFWVILDGGSDEYKGGIIIIFVLLSVSFCIYLVKMIREEGTSILSIIILFCEFLRIIVNLTMLFI